jgi:hypothetical protein
VQHLYQHGTKTQTPRSTKQWSPVAAEVDANEARPGALEDLLGDVAVDECRRADAPHCRPRVTLSGDVLVT